MPDFVAPRLFGNPHLQTLGAALPLYVRPPGEARDEPLRIPIPGGGALHAWAWWHTGTRPTALLVHGVGGSVSSRYMVRAGKAFFAAGYHVVRLDLRGAGESIADAPLLYHAGLTEDLQLAARAIAPRPEVDWIAVVGFSLGGNVSLRFAAEPAPDKVRAVVAISAPLDLAATSHWVNRPLNLPYRAYILRGLMRQARDFAKLKPRRAHYRLSALAKVRTVWEYDDLVIAPMHGFGTAERYYAEMSAKTVLDRIALPSLLVHAADDPLVPGRTVEPHLAARAPALEIAWSARGGHVGWFSGLGERGWVHTWAMERALEFLEARRSVPRPD